MQATGKDDHDYEDHLYDMEAADDKGNAMGNKLARFSYNSRTSL